MNAAVLVPFLADCPWRDRAWSWVRSQWERAGFDVVVGTSTAPGFSRTQAILHARAQSDADVFVVADADVWCDPAAIWAGRAQALASGWAVPNGLLHRLSEESTWRVLAGELWRGLPLSDDNHQDSKPYRIHAGGTLLVLTAEAFDIAPPDPRFVGWGQEDDAWALALRSLIGPEWRGEADLVHLWHPAEPRQTRSIGNQPNVDLLARYRNARTPEAMRGLIEEARTWASRSTTQASTPS